MMLVTPHDEADQCNKGHLEDPHTNAAQDADDERIDDLADDEAAELFIAVMGDIDQAADHPLRKEGVEDLLALCEEGLLVGQHIQRDDGSHDQVDDAGGHPSGEADCLEHGLLPQRR